MLLGWVGARVSDIWEEEEKKTRAKLISVWATFSGSSLSFSLRNIKKETQMQLFTASLRQSCGSARDKSTEAAFVLVVCKMDSESGGERGVSVKPSDFSLF